MQNISLNSPITEIKSIGYSYASKLENINISTVRDLLFHIPSRYQDTSQISTVKDFLEKGDGTFLCQLKNIKTIYTKRRKVFTKATAFDDTSKIEVLWFNQPYLEKTLKEDIQYILDGKITKKDGRKVLYSPKYEIFKGEDKQVHLGKLTTIYPETKGVSSKWIRSKIKLLERRVGKIVKDPLDDKILKENNLLDLQNSIKQIHFPKDIKDIEQARERLAFDEMLSVAFKIEKDVLENKSKESFAQEIKTKKISSFLKSLPYELTKDQKKAYSDILEDLQEKTPMNRLLNGDVGSGKTVVAAVAILNTLENNKSAIVMAPTTVLAQQHYKTFKEIFKNFNIPIELCISEEKIKQDKQTRLIIGTHAILYKDKLPDIGLLIVDEEHRFGVNQRKQLLDLKTSPHFLSMTATPIPRSLTKLIYGEIDISTIKEMPKERIAIQTFYTPFKKRLDCFKWVAEKVNKENAQAFFVYPLIEESEKISAKSVIQEFEELNTGVFKNLKVDFLHGKMKDTEKNNILEEFRKGKIDVLISTSVIEVGIDIPSATIMVIENAERFGLAQLHQLRGRVGRGSKQSYCFVIPGVDSSNEALERLKYFSKHNSGFDVAEYDLNRRGPGEVYGLRQSGIPQFKVAQLRDLDLLKKARKVAKKLIREDNCDVEKIKQNLFK